MRLFISRRAIHRAQARAMTWFLVVMGALALLMALLRIVGYLLPPR